MVARIEELAAQIHEARTLRHQATAEAEALLRSILSHDEEAKPTPMRELVKPRSPDVTVRAEKPTSSRGFIASVTAFSKVHGSQEWILATRV